MDFENSLKRIARPIVDVERAKAAHLRAFRESLAGDVMYAGNAISRLDKFFASEVEPLLAELAQARILDPSRELDKWIDWLTAKTMVPKQLRQALNDLERVTFRELSSPPYLDRIDQFKADNLRRDLSARLTKFGAIEEDARVLISMIKNQVVYLGERAGNVAVEVSRTVPGSIEQAEGADED